MTNKKPVTSIEDIKLSKNITYGDHLKFLEEYYGDMSKRPVVISEMDDVLVDISTPWMEGILEDSKIFQPYFNLEQDFTKELVSEREVYDLNEWLYIKDVKDSMTEDELEFVNMAYMSVYLEDGFYTHLPFTNLGKNIKDLLDNNKIDDLYIISRTIEDKEEEKVRWVMNIFDYNENVHYIPIHGDVKKSYAINDLGVEYDTYVENNTIDMLEVALNTNSISKEYIITKTGYNEIIDELALVVSTNNIKLLQVS